MLTKLASNAIITATVVLPLAGCKTEVISTTYLSDAVSVTRDSKPVSMPIELAIQVGSTNDCAKVKDPLTKAFSAAWKAAEMIGCESEGFDTFARFRVESEMVHEIANKQSDSKHPIYLGAFAENGLITVSYFINSASMDALKRSIPNELTFGSSNPEIILVAKIANDLQSDQTISINDSFVDGAPIARTKEVTLKRRGEVEIRTSDVTAAALQSGDWAVLATFPEPKP